MGEMRCLIPDSGCVSREEPNAALPSCRIAAYAPVESGGEGRDPFGIEIDRIRQHQPSG